MRTQQNRPIRTQQNRPMGTQRNRPMRVQQNTPMRTQAQEWWQHDNRCKIQCKIFWLWSFSRYYDDTMIQWYNDSWIREFVFFAKFANITRYTVSHAKKLAWKRKIRNKFKTFLIDLHTRDRLVLVCFGNDNLVFLIIFSLELGVFVSWVAEMQNNSKKALLKKKCCIFPWKINYTHLICYVWSLDNSLQHGTYTYFLLSGISSDSYDRMKSHMTWRAHRVSLIVSYMA